MRRCGRARTSSILRAPKWWIRRRWRARWRRREFAPGLDVFAKEPAGGAGEFADEIVKLNGVYGTHHIGASTEQAQEAIAAETVRIIRTFRETGQGART